MNKSYIGIPLTEKQEKIIKEQQLFLPENSKKTSEPLHLTLDYLGKEKIKIYGEQILEQFRNKCKDILGYEVIFPYTFLMKNRYLDEYIFALGCDETSFQILKRVYDSMNISKLNSKYSSKDWTPHISIGVISDVSQILKKDYKKKLQEPIKLKLSDMKIL